MDKPLKSVTHGQCDARPTVAFPAAGHHRVLTGTKLYCLVTDAHVCEQLAQGLLFQVVDQPELIPPVPLETSEGVLSTVDMVVQRRDDPCRLRDHVMMMVIDISVGLSYNTAYCAIARIIMHTTRVSLQSASARGCCHVSAQS